MGPIRFQVCGDSCLWTGADCVRPATVSDTNVRLHSPQCIPESFPIPYIEPYVPKCVNKQVTDFSRNFYL